jgi:MFS family permease
LYKLPSSFFVCRLFQGIFGGVVGATAAFAGSEAPPGKQGHALGRLQGAAAAGSLIGPLIGGALISLWGFRPLLLLMGALTGICALAVSFLLTESQRDTVKISSTSTGIVQTFKSLFHYPRTRAFILAGICAKVGSFGLVTAFAPFVREIIDSPTYAATWVGALQAATWGATFIGSPWWGKNNDHKPVEQNFIWASLLCGLSIVLQALVQELEWLFVFRVIQGFSFSALVQSVFFVVLKSSDKEDNGVSIGSTNSFLVLGQIIGSIIGATLAGYLSFEGIFIIMGLVFLLSSFLIDFSAKKYSTTQSKD